MQSYLAARASSQDPKPAAGGQPSGGPTVCTYFQKGSCIHGVNCRNVHPGQEKEQAAARAAQKNKGGGKGKTKGKGQQPQQQQQS